MTDILSRVARDVLTGMAQIMLQPSPIVGAAFVVGACFNSVWLALFGIIGCLSSTLMARALDFPDDEQFDGLYGFNGGLVGLAVGYFFATQLPLLFLVVPGAMITSLIMFGMLRRGMSPFTFPFVLVTWVILLIVSVTGLATPTPWSQPSIFTIDLLQSLARGYGQVLFQENVLTGIIFIAAITARNWVQGIYATLATVLGLLIGYLVGLPIDAVNLGLFGYNGVLCAILFAGRTGKDFIYAIGAIILSIIFVRTAHLGGMPALTFPFVLSSWLVLWWRRPNVQKPGVP